MLTKSLNVFLHYGVQLELIESSSPNSAMNGSESIVEEEKAMLPA